MKLNWRDFFMNENLLTDALKYRDWDHKNLEIPEKETLLKDLTRTRNDDPFFKKESTQKYMMLLATFYCQQNKVNYQQGMLEVVVPFLLLKNKDFPIQKCYSYFNQFMCMYFPKVLEWNLVEGNKELAHVLSAIQFCEVLLKYHCADFYNRILRIEEFNISMVVTPLIMTLFAKGTPIQLVFLIFDEYMKRHNQNYIFFMISALFETRKQDILERDDDEELLPYLSRNLKELNTQDDVMQLFSIADTQYSQTPVSYEHLISHTSFHDKSGNNYSILVLSVEDIKELTELDQSYYSKCIFMELNEMRSLLGVSSKKAQKQIQLKVMDIRNTQKPKLKEYIPKKYITKQPNNSHHTCLITDSNETLNQAIKIADELLMKGVNHVSILKGGFANLFNLTKTSKDCCVM